MISWRSSDNKEIPETRRASEAILNRMRYLCAMAMAHVTRNEYGRLTYSTLRRYLHRCASFVGGGGG
jgi:hypothetical protein